MTITPDTLLNSAAVADRLSMRARNAMNHMKRTRGMHTVRDFASCRRSELLELRNCGEGTLAELTGFIREAGLKWATPLADQPPAAPPEPQKDAITITPDTLLASPAVRQRLSNRAYNAITRYCFDDNGVRRDIKTINDLVAFGETEIKRFRGVGRVVLAELTSLIREAGLEWGRPTDEQPKAAPPEPKPALPKVVQLASVGDEMLAALLDDGTIWWTGGVSENWKQMPPPRPCIAPDNTPA